MSVLTSAVDVAVREPIVALPLLLAQVPPAEASVNVVVKPKHTVKGPDIAEGKGLTVTTAVMMQPVGNVYVIVAVLVTATTPPVTIPVKDPMLAVPVALLLQMPPAVALLNAVVRPAHMIRVPRIAVGNGLTVTIVVITQPVPNE